MSIEMYLSETKQQATQAIRLANAYSQTVGDIATSCQAFFNAPLSSQTYDSAKTYFTTVYPPLVHGVMMVCEALALAQQAFPDTYESEVDTCDLKEEDLKQRIEQGRQLLATQQATLQALEESDPALEERMSSTQDTLKDLEEKLTNLYAFHASSPTLFADVESLLAQLQSGMTEVAKGQAWNSQTETFDLRRINLKWITPLNRAWQAHQAEKAGRKMDESLNKKLQNYTLIKCYDAINNQTTWSIEDNGKRVNDPALQKYLSEIGAYLLESDYAILKVTPKEWATRINNHWKNGTEYFQGGDVPFVFRGFGHVQDYVEHRYEDGTWDALWALGMTAATIRHAMIWDKASGAESINKLPESNYIPQDAQGNPISLKKHGDIGCEIPLPDPLAEGRPHTALGGKTSSINEQIYRQTAEFNGSWPKANGYEVPLSEVHWGDHGQQQHHPNPHQHVFTYDWDQKRWVRGVPENFNPKK